MLVVCALDIVNTDRQTSFEHMVDQNGTNMNAACKPTHELRCFSHGYAARQTCGGVKTNKMVHQRSKKGAPTSSARPEQTLKEWAARKAEVHKRQARRNMADAKDAAVKAEAKHKAHLRKVHRETKPRR